jgi:hypothetical protein
VLPRVHLCLPTRHRRTVHLVSEFVGSSPRPGTALVGACLRVPGKFQTASARILTTRRDRSLSRALDLFVVIRLSQDHASMPQADRPAEHDDLVLCRCESHEWWARASDRSPVFPDPPYEVKPAFVAGLSFVGTDPFAAFKWLRSAQSCWSRLVHQYALADFGSLYRQLESTLGEPALSWSRRECSRVPDTDESVTAWLSAFQSMSVTGSHVHSRLQNQLRADRLAGSPDAVYDRIMFIRCPGPHASRSRPDGFVPSLD